MLEDGVLALDTKAGTIVHLGAEQEHDGPVVDLGARTVVPGYVDVHVHGAVGSQVNGDDPEEVSEAIGRLASYHASHGTTSLLATTVTDSEQRLVSTLRGIALAREASRAGAKIVGAHLEGPFISPRRAGAQDPSHVRPPDPAEFDRLLEAGGGSVAMITLAPELPGAFGLIERAVSRGVAVSLGHSDTDFDTAVRGFSAGARHATHLFNAMAALHHRRPGLVGAALVHPEVTVEVIADLEHLHPAVMELVSRCAAGRLVAVTDAATSAGLGAGRYSLGGREVVVSDGRVELANDPSVLAGSLLTMDRAVANLLAATSMTLEQAVAAATAAPASLLGPLAPPGTGRIVEGGPADLVVLEDDLSVAATLVGGVAVHDPAGLFA